MSLKRVWIPSPNYSSRGGSGVRLVVIHTAEGASNFRDLGNFFASSSAGVSSHVGIDDELGSIGEYVHRPDKAWCQANYNPQSICAELCGTPEHGVACGANWTSSDWAKHQDMLINTADWIAEECAYYGLPVTKLSSSQAQGGSKGVCGHADLGSGGGGHWDPGPNFPWSQVMDMARGGSGATQPTEEGELLASAVSATNVLHVFRGDGKTVQYTYQRPNESSWNGGQQGKGPAGWSTLAKADSDIIGISAETSESGALHVFVECSNGHTYYTYQRKGETAWAGGQKGEQVAGLSLFAP